MITLVIGGTRSGKSEVAERIASDLGSSVTVIAPGSASDPDMAARIAAHRARRPAEWSTIECGAELIDGLTGLTGVVIIDSLGSWVAATEDFKVDADRLLRVLMERGDANIVVTEEVGLAVHPPTEAGRAFTDALGALNTTLASVADEAILVIAGRTMRLDPPAG